MGAKEKALPACSSLSALCAMMDGDETSLPSWSAHDLEAILKHLLGTPLDRELDVAHHQASGPPWTFADVLSRRDVPHVVLLRVKDYAKQAMNVDDALPKDAAKALYAAVIAHARACGQAGISSLSTVNFERLCRWCLAQSWAPQAIRRAVREGLKAT